MKRFKKLLAFSVACVMVIGTMNMMSFAANPVIPSSEMNDVNFDGVLEVSGLDEGDVVTFYKVLQWDGSQRSEGSYGGWIFTDDFAGVGTSMKDADGNAYADDASAVEGMIGDPDKIPFGLNSQNAGVLALKAKELTGESGSAVGADGISTLAISSDNGPGLYMALITPADANTVYNPVFVSADFETTKDPGTSSWIVDSSATYANRSAAKKSTTGTNKEAEADTDTSYDLTWLSARPGEIVKFTVDFTIPGYGDVYVSPKFDITDKLTGMKLASAPVITEPAGLTADTDYKITGAVGATQFTIKFDPAYLKTVSVPTKVVVTYEAEILDGENVNVNQEKNEIWTEYSHDPKNPTDYDVKKDVTTHYTYTIDANAIVGNTELIGVSGSEIVKVGVDAHGDPITEEKIYSKITDENYYQSPLAGASFLLHEDNNGSMGDPYKKADGSELGELKSGDDGRITITGLDAGTYWLEEIKAPNGYIRSTDPVKIEIVPEFSISTVTEYFKDGEWSETEPAEPYKTATYEVQTLLSYQVLYNGSAAATYTYDNEGTTEIKISEAEEIPTSIINTKGVELPATGGMGTTIFYVIGAVLVLGAGILLVTRRRMNVQ